MKQKKKRVRKKERKGKKESSNEMSLGKFSLLL